MAADLQTGQLITASFLPGVAEVKAFSWRAGYWKLEAVLQDDSRQYISHNLSAEQLAQVQVVQQSGLQRVPDAEEFFLFIEANRIRLAYQFDPQLAVSIPQVDPMPHQIEAVYHYVLQSPTQPQCSPTPRSQNRRIHLHHRNRRQIIRRHPPQGHQAAGD